jgi:hypothetical protein
MKYICPVNDCSDFKNKENCPHGVPHNECVDCLWGNNICPNCVEVKDEE